MVMLEDPEYRQGSESRETAAHKAGPEFRRK
jgi:hypothetical protein